MSKKSFFINHSIKSLYIDLILISFIGAVFFINPNEKTVEKKSKKKYQAIELEKLIEKADKYYDEEKLDSSYYFYNKVLPMYDPEIDYTKYVYTLSSMAEIQTLIGNFIESEELLTKTLPYLSKIKEPIYARNVYSNMGMNYYNTYDFENSLFYHTKALKLPGTPYKKAIVLNDIARVYMEQNRYDIAAEILEMLTARKIVYKREPLLSDYFYASLQNSLGVCYFNLKKPKALDLYLKSLATTLQGTNKFILLNNYKSLSDYYMENNPELALQYAKKSYETAREVNANSAKMELLAYLIKLSKGSELKKYTIDYIKLTDSVINSRKSARNQFTNIKYYSKINKDENLHLKAEKAENELKLQQHKTSNIISGVIITFILTLCIILSFYLSIKGRKQKNNAIQESETRISNKLRNELLNEVQNVLTYAKNNDLETADNKNELLESLEKIYSQTRNISKENSDIITDKRYSLTLKNMISTFKTTDTNVFTNGLTDINWIKIDKNKKIIIYRVIQELLVNMKKHSSATLAGVNFKVIKKNIIINYTDNGKGVNMNQVSKSGLQIIENRILNVKGEIQFESNPDNGFKISIKIPF